MRAGLKTSVNALLEEQRNLATAFALLPVLRLRTLRCHVVYEFTFDVCMTESGHAIAVIIRYIRDAKYTHDLGIVVVRARVGWLTGADCPA